MRNRLDRNKGGGDREQQSSSSPSVNASKDTVAQTSSGIFTKTRAIQFVVLIWVTRLSFLAISYGLPTIIVIFQEISRKIAGSSPQSVVEVAWTDDMKEFLSADSEDFPKVIRGCPLLVAPSDLSKVLLETNALPPFVATAVGTNHSNFFTYRSSNTRWNGRVNDSHYEYRRMESDALLDILYSKEIDSESNIDKDYYYLGQTLDRPFMHPLVQSVAPYFADQISSRHSGHASSRQQQHHSPAVMRLWLSSRGAVTTMHYDIERNYFLQLSGSKTFVLANADAYLFLQLHSFLHPRWRQSQLDNISTLDNFIDAAVSYMDSSLLDGDLNCSENKALFVASHHPSNPVCRYQAQIAEISSSLSFSSSSSSSYAVHMAQARRDIVRRIFDFSEVTLRAGDMLHLPPFTFHCVTAGDKSASVNAWVGSQEYNVAKRIRTQIPLPFDSKDSLDNKLLGIRFMLFKLFSSFGFKGIRGIEYTLFIDTLRSRFTVRLSTEDDDNRTYDEDFRFCKWNFTNEEISLYQQGWNRQVSKSASMMITVLEAVVETRIAVRNILISDYFDEIIDLAYTESRSSSASSASAATSDRKGGSSDEDVIRPRYVLSYISNCLRPPHM